MTECVKRSKKLGNKDGELTMGRWCLDNGNSDEDGNLIEVG